MCSSLMILLYLIQSMDPAVFTNDIQQLNGSFSMRYPDVVRWPDIIPMAGNSLLDTIMRALNAPS